MCFWTTVSAKSYCYEMKVIEAFSWMTFVLRQSSPTPPPPLTKKPTNLPPNFVTVAIFLWILITLTSRAKAFGRYGAWFEPIVELPWFGQYPGPDQGGAGGAYYSPGRHNYAYPAGSPMMPPYGAAGVGGVQPQLVNGGYVVPQAPGHSVVIQPSAHGGPPMITQVPGHVQQVV